MAHVLSPLDVALARAIPAAGRPSRDRIALDGADDRALLVGHDDLAAPDAPPPWALGWAFDEAAPATSRGCR